MESAKFKIICANYKSECTDSQFGFRTSTQHAAVLPIDDSKRFER